jgi:hypothetical protein
VRLVEAAGSAPATVVAVVKDSKRVDTHGYTALLEVERRLWGPIEAGAERRIAWEELAASRAPRFREGERILVSLERLPGASIWRQRFPDPAVRSTLLAVAMRGDAFLRRPGSAGLDLLQNFLALGDEDRKEGTGVGYLAALTLVGELPLARDAVQQLAACSKLDAKLGPRSSARLVDAMLREDASHALQDAIVALIRERRLESTRPTLEALVALEPPPPPIVFSAIAQLDQGLAPQQTARLLEGQPPRHRAVAARWASGPRAPDTLAQLARSDPAPEVRSAAITRLVELRGEHVAEDIVTGLSDPALEVRRAAVQGLGSLGDEAVPSLRQVVDANDPEAAQAALAALSLCGTASASAALNEIAAQHPDASLRALAEIGLGRPVGNQH